MELLGWNGETIKVKPTPSPQRGGYSVTLERDQNWRVVVEHRQRKQPGMQGPIDDAFCSRFLFVVPSRPAAHGVAQRFIDREMKYAARRWRTLMRGKIRFAKDVEVTDAHIENANLICFGDFTSNRFLAKIASKLPFEWSKVELSVGNQTHAPATSVLAFCYPNPDNPNRYIVANSGMTMMVERLLWCDG